MTTIEWADRVGALPRMPRNAGRTQRFVHVLRTRPGVFARWPHPVVRQMVRSNTMNHPGTEWTIRPDGSMWGRWVGQDQSTTERGPS